VVEIMQSLGYLDNGETVDTASRKLRVEDISNIATRYAEEHGPRAVIQETNLGSTPPVNSLPYDISTA
jgi:hypothetical protein